MIIKDNLDRHFKAARAGGLVKTASEVPLPETPRLLPKVNLESKVNGGRSLYGQKMMEKISGLMGTSGGANVTTSSPEIRNPLLNLINFYLPYDRKTLNQWIRYYDRFNPYIGNCIDIHGEFPMSDFHFTGVSDKEILQFFEEQKERANLVQYCFEASREYELIGEVFAFWQWDEDQDIWTDYTIINPDLLDVKVVNWGSGSQAIYTYEPAQELKELIKDRDDRVLDALTELDPVVYENLLAGKKIPLDDFNVMSMVRKASPYESRGTSIVMRCLKDLMYEDKLREAQYAIADQQITPVQIWKLGDVANGYMPTAEDLQDFRALLLAGRHDPLFTIVSHAAVNLELVGYTGKLLPVIPEFEFVAKRVMVGLFTNEAMVTGNGPTYSNALVAMKVLQGRYQSKRDKFIQNFKRRLFEPLAKAHGFIERSQAELAHRVRTTHKYIVPGMEWNFKLDLTDQSQRMQYLMQLRDKVQIPMKVICEVLDLPYESVKASLKSEEGTVFDPVYQDVRSQRSQDSGTAGPEGGDLGVGGAPVGGGGGGEEGAEDATETETPDETSAAAGEETAT